MTALLEDRTLSMILTIPDIKEVLSSLSHSVVESVDKNLPSSLKNHAPLSIPIYHGSIIDIEQHNDDESVSDLIVRVPNVNYLSLPYIHFSSNVSNLDQLHETESQQEARIKRRAPICPILKHSQNLPMSLNKNQTLDSDSSNQNQSEANLPLINTKRLAIAVRNIGRAFTTTCKTKPSSNVNEITIIPVLPDVEVITENFQISKLPKKTTRHQNSASKFFAPKILRIKRKHFQIKKGQLSEVSGDTKTKNKPSRTGSPSKKTCSENNTTEQQNELKHITRIKFNNEVEQQSTTGKKIISITPISITNTEPSPTHCYSSIPPASADAQILITEKNSSNISSSTEITTNTVQIDSFISKENIDRKSPIHKDHESLKDTDSNIDERLYVVHPNGDTYSECYEITYELDPEYENYFNNKQEEIHSSKVEDQSLVKLNVNGLEYEDLASTITGFSKFNANNCTEIDDDRMNQSLNKPESKTTNLTEVKFDLTEDVSQISNEQPSIYQPELVSTFPSTQDNDYTACTIDTPVIYEDYTIILQILKNVLQIDQLLQPNETNDLEQK